MSEKIKTPVDENINKDELKITNTSENEQINVKRNKKLIILSIVFVIFILLIIFSTIFAFFNINNSKIINGVKINNVDVSGLTIDEAKEKISKEFSLQTNLNLIYEDYSYIISPTDIAFIYDINSAIEKAYLVGRDSNLVFNNYEIFFTLIGSKNIDLNYSYNQEKLDNIINNIALELPGLVLQPSYYIEDSNLIINAGTEGISLEKEELLNLIIENINNTNSNSGESVDIIIPVTQVSLDDIDIDKIYSEIYTEPEDAYIEDDPFELHVGVDGVDFAISIDEAKSLLLEDLNEYVIPLTITKPNITTNDLGDKIFAQTLSNYSTRYDVSNTNRATNVELATSKLNGVIILPGETFSYNKTVGERTISAGFKEASIYTNSGVEYGLGGGICQVSSTLYNVALEANLEIVERKNHRYYVSYVPLGRDATVSYGSIDLKFKNTRTYPIKIQAEAKNGVVDISILGMKEDIEYDITIVTEQLEVTPFETQYINDSSLPSGTQVVKQVGYYGYKYQTYKVVSLNGSIVSKTLISTDTYSPLTKIIRVGTK